MTAGETAHFSLFGRAPPLRHYVIDEVAMYYADSAGKAAASFDGQMRDIAAKLMDHFRIHDLLGLSNSSQLFGAASGRAHYTSAYRYPVLANKNGVWANYSGGEDVRSQSNPLLSGFVNDYLIPELQCFPDAWIIPFGPTPAAILSELGRSGIVDASKILAGLNHPTGQQWNRHRCQLDMVDHDRCATNVGCSKIQQRSLALRSRVLALLA